MPATQWQAQWHVTARRHDTYRQHDGERGGKMQRLYYAGIIIALTLFYLYGCAYSGLRVILRPIQATSFGMAHIILHI
jgi:hypothetical protein